MQNTSHILMIRPVRFAYNAETAVNNAFQVNTGDRHVQERALSEFDAFVGTLRANQIDVLVVDDTPEPHTPDAIFPNNWISFHPGGVVCLYPMFAPNRRLERKPGVLAAVEERIRIRQRIDLTSYEEKEEFLEGTGSMVLDRDNRVAYACLSPRTDRRVLDAFCRQFMFQPFVFSAHDARGLPIYHTNVMMCVADHYAVVCLDALPDPAERTRLEAQIGMTGKVLIPISLSQMAAFAGNMLQVQNASGEKIVVMSSRAYRSLTPIQREELTMRNRIVHAPLDVIETHGGGSARCMMAELFD